MGCANSNVHKRPKKDLSLLNFDQRLYYNDSLLDEFEKDQRENIVSNAKKLQHYFDICQNKENVELMNLTFVDSSFFEFINKIGKNNKIEVLFFKNIEFEGKTEFMAHLANTLSGKTSLKQIKLISVINGGKKLAKAVAKILQDCPNIEKISLVELDFENEDCEYIGSLLDNNYKNFKVFKISGVFMKEKLENFFEGLKKNIIIEELSLQKMNLRENNISLLLNSLINNTHLKCLDVSNNPIGDAVSYFCESEEYFNCLHTLKMNNCDITDENINSLLNSLALNKSIKILELNSNHITNASKDYLVSFFNANQFINTIYLLKNKIFKREISASFRNRDLIKMVLEI